MRTFVAAATAAIFSSAAFAQQPSQSAALIPDFSGIWGHLSLPGFEPPRSGPGPVVNKSRTRQLFDADGRPATNGTLVSNPISLVGDYTNPILKPQAAEVVKKQGEIELSGMPAPIPSTQCWPGGVPFVFRTIGMQMLPILSIMKSAT
jgi:hypothetical protein